MSENRYKTIVLPPRSPILDGHVERAQRTNTEEFYYVMDTRFEIKELTQTLLEWERIYNTVSPHSEKIY